MTILCIIRICLCNRRWNPNNERPPRQLVVIPGTSNPANPYNAGYDQAGRIRTMGIPPSYVRSMNGSTPGIHPSYDRPRTGSAPGIPPTNGQIVKPTTPGNPSPSDPYNTGYDQPR
ncbi:uncharacterized protein [Argopecten irradians]|uniref:uncharacterized protein n=1 Tax=Argopecten irradians TaxID=31199 RepID=UPI00371ADE94